MTDQAASLDVTEQLAGMLRLPDEAGTSVQLTATITADLPARHWHAGTFEVLQAIVRALDRDVLMRRVAERAEIDPETLLWLMLRQFEAAAASSDRGEQFSAVEQQALTDAGVDLSGLPQDAPDPAELTAARFTVLFSHALTVTDAAARLSVTTGRIRQRLSEGTLHGVRAGRGEWRLPLWQFSGQGTVPGLDIVLAQLPDFIHPLALEGFMTRTDVDLEVDGTALSPVNWLASGGDPRVIADLVRALPSAA